ncbi:LuxR C-terminal-related transcriptional regulator [Streptomyces sp. NPDC017979]|uniref:LuxR C-terminal-related transcriptional regulator n=1 Tax=Streptomyces sp. NPDC017979 TaxID=3365024 RepID=UPI003788EB0E
MRPHPPPHGAPRSARRPLATVPAARTARTSRSRPATAAARAELLRRVERAPHPLALFVAASTRLRRLMPYDAAVWRATDPETGLMTAPVHAEHADAHGCAAYWDIELSTERINRYGELARRAVPVAGLHHTTGGALERSPLYRHFLRARGLHDELRIVLALDGRPHGTVSLFRAEGHRPFDAADTALAASLVTPLARRLRSYAAQRPETTPDPAPSGPGLLVFDGSGALVSANDAAHHHLDRLPDGPREPAATPSPPVPAWLRALTLRARAGTTDPVRLRLRTRDGTWLVCHATALRPAGTAVVLEPAKPSDVLPLLADAFDLSERELEVCARIARGLPTAGIAAELLLSPHTVRDHVKAVFEKTGVTSRGELVSLLYLDRTTAGPPTGLPAAEVG